MKAPTEIKTARLLLRIPTANDVEAIFSRYASDEAVGRYLAWPVHRSLQDTRAFLEFSESEWKRWPAGPYLIHALDGHALLGSTGLSFETKERASTGYVIARDAWGRGFATEAVAAMKKTAARVGVRYLFAHCHPDHLPSRRVLEKSGFTMENTVRRHCEFPNLAPGVLLDTASYSWRAEPK